MLRVKRPNAERPYRAIGYPVLPAVYILMAAWICIVLLRYKPQYTWPGLVIVLLGIPVFACGPAARLLDRRPGGRVGPEKSQEEQPRMAKLFAIKPFSSCQEEARAEGEHTLRRSLGPINLITLGIGAIIGTGIFVLTGIAAAQFAGPAIVLSFVIAGCGCVFAGLCYAEFASMIPIAGSAYTYGYATMGEIVAWIIGWALVLEYAFGAATVAVGWSGYVSSLLGYLRGEAPVQPNAGCRDLAVRADAACPRRHFRPGGDRGRHRDPRRRACGNPPTSTARR